MDGGLHVADNASKQRLQSLIGGRVRKIADEDLRGRGESGRVCARETRLLTLWPASVTGVSCVGAGATSVDGAADIGRDWATRDREESVGGNVDCKRSLSGGLKYLSSLEMVVDERRVSIQIFAVFNLIPCLQLGF